MYYPKSQIKPNLYTNGGEFILSTTKENYKGNYYKVSSGKLYSGKNPTDKPNILLTLLDSNSPEEFKQTFNPDLITTQDDLSNGSYPLNPPIRTIPLFNPTLPTDQDKQNGQFNRYFCKKTNELKYLEIDKETHTKLQAKDLKIAWDLYEPASLLWVIKGNQETVFNTNKASVFKIEQNQRWNGFSQYFKENYSKYFSSQDINNLYTSGGEFTTKNGQNYIGFYHIHKGTIPMAGKTHTQYFHETLIPTKLSLNKNSKFSEILASITLALDNTGNPTNPADPTNPSNPTTPGDLNPKPPDAADPSPPEGYIP